MYRTDTTSPVQLGAPRRNAAPEPSAAFASAAEQNAVPDANSVDGQDGAGSPTQAKDGDHRDRFRRSLGLATAATTPKRCRAGPRSRRSITAAARSAQRTWEASAFHIANTRFWEAALIPIAVVMVVAFSSCLDLWIGRFVSLACWYAANLYAMVYAFQVLHPQVPLQPLANGTPFAGNCELLVWSAGIAGFELIVCYCTGRPKFAQALGTTVYSFCGCFWLHFVLAPCQLFPGSWQGHKVMRYAVEHRLLELPTWLPRQHSFAGNGPPSSPTSPQTGKVTPPAMVGAVAEARIPESVEGAYRMPAGATPPPAPRPTAPRAAAAASRPGARAAGGGSVAPVDRSAPTWAGHAALAVAAYALLVSWTSTAGGGWGTFRALSSTRIGPQMTAAGLTTPPPTFQEKVPGRKLQEATASQARGEGAAVPPAQQLPPPVPETTPPRVQEPQGKEPEAPVETRTEGSSSSASADHAPAAADATAGGAESSPLKAPSAPQTWTAATAVAGPPSWSPSVGSGSTAPTTRVRVDWSAIAANRSRQSARASAVLPASRRPPVRAKRRQVLPPKAKAAAVSVSKLGSGVEDVAPTAAQRAAEQWQAVLLVGAAVLVFLWAVDQDKTFEFSVSYLIVYNVLCLRVPDLLGHAIISTLAELHHHTSPALATTAISLTYMCAMQAYIFVMSWVCQNMTSEHLFPRFQFVAQMYYYLFWYMMLMVVSPGGVEDTSFWVMVAMLNGNYLVSNIGVLRNVYSALRYRSQRPDPPLKTLFDSKLAVQDQLADIVSLLIIPAIATSFHTCAALSMAQYPGRALVSLWQRFGALLAARLVSGLLTEEIFRRRLDLLFKADTMELQLLPLDGSPNRLRYLNDICIGPKLALESMRNIERCEFYFAAVAVMCTFSVFQHSDEPTRYAFIAFGK